MLNGAVLAAAAMQREEADIGAANRIVIEQPPEQEVAFCLRKRGEIDRGRRHCA